MEKLKNKANIIYCALFIYLMASSFINQDVYAFTVRFASAVIFLVLGVLSLPYIYDDLKNKNPDLILTVITVVLSVVFVLITGSGYGAAFIPSDLALICYVSRHIRPGKQEIKVLSFAGAVPVMLWYSHVRWSYNFNMAGFAFMLMAFFAMILVECVCGGEDAGKGSGVPGGTDEYGTAQGGGSGKADSMIELLRMHRGFVEFIIFFTAFILSMLYHSRTVMFGMIMFALIYLLASGVWVYRIVFLLASVGAVLFTAVYIKFAAAFDNITILYKDVFSGRQGIWRELWGAFLESPVTGIGSAYDLKSFEIFEVHNGMFDILVVHGIIVFVLVVVLLFRMFERAYPNIPHKEKRRIRRIALSAAFAMMFTSYFENFFTVPPYSIIFLTFILFAKQDSI